VVAAAAAALSVLWISKERLNKIMHNTGKHGLVNLGSCFLLEMKLWIGYPNNFSYLIQNTFNPFPIFKSQ
jgi:hypothetical protein